MEHIQECLALAKRQGVLPPVRIARILAGEHPGQFSTDRKQGSHVRSGKNSKNHHGVPLSVALDYVGTILDESRSEITRLKSEVEEYNNICNAMENEINMLLRVSGDLPQGVNEAISIDGSTTTSDAMTTLANRLNVDDLYYQIRASDDVDKFADRVIVSDAREAFWREMNQTEDTFETISRFFAKGLVN
jgi:vacuolar protein sorting-associated protein 11